MSANTTGDTTAPLVLKLKGCGAEYEVSTMVLSAEMGRLPQLLLHTAASNESAVAEAPLVDAGPYSLELEKNGKLSTPFGVSHWFIQSVSNLTQYAHQSAFCLRLGALPGQALALQGYASDVQPLSAVLQEVSNKFLGQRTLQSRFIEDDPTVGAVVSFNETMAQFLARMAMAANTWLWVEDLGADTLTLQWQSSLQGRPAPANFDAAAWPTTCVATERTAAVKAVRTFWPRSSITQPVKPRTSSELFTREVINLLPTPAQAHEHTTPNASPWETDYHLSDSLSHASAWPGLQAGESRVIFGVIHVYDQSATGDVRRQLGQLVPGIRQDTTLSMLASDAAYGVLALSTQFGQGYAGAVGALSRQQLANKADQLGAALGIPVQATPETQEPPPNFVLATVCPWDAEQSATWAGGGLEGSHSHTTHIKVQFDWSEVPVRVPCVAPMSGHEGVLFFPPAAGDRVLVLLDRLWPVAATGAMQADDILLPSVLRCGADLDSLSAQRGMVVRGGLIFRTADNGDLVIHAAGNLVLRAEKDVFLDGQHLRERGRRKAKKDPEI
jgi:hypothetical protein